MTIKLNRENEIHINQKRVLRLMRILGLKSVCRRPRKNYIKSTPEITAENKLNREFKSSSFGEKWLTDVTEMKYGNSNKAYLSAILDLADKSIVSFVTGHINNNEMVFETFDIAHRNHSEAHPCFIATGDTNTHRRHSKRNWMRQGWFKVCPGCRDA